MFQLHQADGFCHFSGLFGINRQRFTGQRIAKPTGTGANFPQYHKGSGAAIPAFTHVGATPTGADGVEVVFLYNFIYQGEVFGTLQVGFKPCRLSEVCHFLKLILYTEHPCSLKSQISSCTGLFAFFLQN